MKTVLDQIIDDAHVAACCRQFAKAAELMQKALDHYPPETAETVLGLRQRRDMNEWRELWLEIDGDTSEY